MADDTAASAVKNSNDGTTQAPQGGPMSLGGAGSGTYWDAVNKTWVVFNAPPSTLASTASSFEKALANTRLNTAQVSTLNGISSNLDPAVKKLTETQSISPGGFGGDLTGLSGTATGYTSAGTPNTFGGVGTGPSTVDYGNLQDFGGAGASDFQIAEGRATPGSTPGVGSSAEGDGAANTRQVLATFNKKVFLPKDNVLDQYASYTYNIGWYLMSPANYKELLKTKKPNIANYSLLAQSGGAPTGTTPSDAGGARNQFFGLDYYIDDLEITSVVSGKGGKRAHNAQEITFKVTEPAGITLINNIQKAVASVYKNDMKYGLAVFCLVIRFYGYDENGKIVSARNSENKDAIVEKFIPFYISNVSFRIANKIVEYDVKATPVVYHVGFGTQSGTIKAPIEITGSTVSQILNGNGTDNNSVSADDGRVDVPSPNTTQSSLQGSSDFYG